MLKNKLFYKKIEAKIAKYKTILGFLAVFFVAVFFWLFFGGFNGSKLNYPDFLWLKNLSKSSLEISNNYYDKFLKNKFSIAAENPETISPESIIPKPQNIQMLADGPAIIDSSWEIIVDLSDENDSFVAGYLKDEILNVSEQNVDLEILDIGAQGDFSKKIIIGDPANNSQIASISSIENIDVNTELADDAFNQGYILLIEPEQIFILAKSSAGRFYGMISLVWLLKNNDGPIILPNTKIIDWPDLKMRGFYGAGTWQWDDDKTIDTSTTDGQKDWIDSLARYKYNFWHYGLNTSADELLEREDFLKKRHFFTGLSSVVSETRYRDKTLYEGVFVQNIEAVFNNDNVAVVSPIEFTDKNPGFELDNSPADDFPDSWHKIAQGTSEWSLDREQHYSGFSSVKLTLPYDLAENKSSASLVSGTTDSDRFYNLEPNRIYQISVMAKKDLLGNDERGQIQINCAFYDDDGVSLDRTTSLVLKDGDAYGDNGWYKYSTMFSTYNGEAKMYIYSRALSTNALNLWLDDLKVIEVSSKLVNVIENDSTSISIRDYESNMEYEEGRDYYIERSGALNPEAPLNGNQIVIKRISGGNVSPQTKILIDYDFLPKMHQFAREYNSFADPQVFEVYKNSMLDPVLKVITPDFVFIGMDEVGGFNRDSRSKELNLENYELMAQFMNKTIDVIHDNYDPNIKVLIWDDMVNPYHNGKSENYQVRYGGQPGKTQHALGLIEKENVVFLSWYYDDSDLPGKMLNSPALYNQLGAEFLGGPWDSLINIKKWSYVCYKNNSLGMIDHEFYNNINGVKNVANYAWNAIKDYDMDNPPILFLDNSYEIERGKTLEFPVQATDADGDSVSFVCSNLPSEAKIVDADISDNQAVFRWKPPADASGVQMVTIEAKDNKGGDIPLDVYIELLNNDGLDDAWEKKYFNGSLKYIDTDDPDGDGLNNIEEYNYFISMGREINPNNPDTDGDGMSDKWEIDNSLDPTQKEDSGGSEGGSSSSGSGGSENKSFFVSAGSDQTINFSVNRVSLNATIYNLLNIHEPVIYKWLKASGPGTVIFSDASAKSTTATFSKSGGYILLFSANGGGFSASDQVSIKINKSVDGDKTDLPPNDEADIKKDSESDYNIFNECGKKNINNLYSEEKEVIECVSKKEAQLIDRHSVFVPLDDIGKKLYIKIISQSKSELKIQYKYSLAEFIHKGTPTTIKLGAGERAGVINSYEEAFDKIPQTEEEWQDIIKIGNGRWPSERNEDKENKVKNEMFKKIYKREADMDNANDNAAVTIMSYGLRPVNRNLESEKAGIKTFKAIFGVYPSDAVDWDIVRAISYSGAVR